MWVFKLICFKYLPGELIVQTVIWNGVFLFGKITEYVYFLHFRIAYSKCTTLFSVSPKIVKLILYSPYANAFFGLFLRILVLNTL